MKKQTTPRESLEILASGSGWIAVDKPAGVSVHNDPGKDLYALAANRLRADADLKDATGLEDQVRLGAAHRLDRETSGVIVLAGEKAVLSHFAAQFENRTAQKYYTAIVHGRLRADDGPDGWAAWNWSLTKTAGGRKNPRGKGSRKECRTLVRVRDHSDHYTLVECKLLTGRKHQIRRHAKLAGHPVVGDRRYGSPRALNFLRTRHAFDRLALHAARLDVLLPGGQRLTIHARPLPKAMQRLFDGDRPTPNAHHRAKR